MATYYHVADPSYVGGDLLCRDELDAAGVAPAWKWDEAEEGFDTDVVCLFETRDEADAFRAETLPDGHVLRVDLPDDPGAWGIRLVRVAEGYPAVRRRIEARWVSAA